MSEGLERWIAYETRYWRSLVTADGDEVFLERWADRVRRTAPFVPSVMVFRPRLEADSAFTPPERHIPMPAALDAEWQGYVAEWEGFLDRNPRARLAAMLCDIAESFNASPFPVGWEGMIRDWVRAGTPGPFPFVDRHGIDGPDWRRKLRETAAQARAGWVYAHGDRLVWVEDGEYPAEGIEVLRDMRPGRRRDDE